MRAREERGPRVRAHEHRAQLGRDDPAEQRRAHRQRQAAEVAAPAPQLGDVEERGRAPRERATERGVELPAHAPEAAVGGRRHGAEVVVVEHDDERALELDQLAQRGDQRVEDLARRRVGNGL